MNEARQAEHVAHESNALVNKIAPLFAGRDPLVQGATLALLLATWLDGWSDPDGGDATKQTREDMLRMHVKLVRSLMDPPLP